MFESNKSVDSKQFENTIRSGVSLVDFNAPWCGPCRTQKPIIDQLAAKFKEKALIVELNVDENQHLAMHLSVMSIPTLILFKDGKEVRRFVGVQGVEVLSEAVEKAMT
jgi:thioredoxin